MPNNRTQIVFELYEKKKKEKQLSSVLANPTPAGLRDECLKVYIDRQMPNDDLLLKSFFGALGNDKDYVARIENFDIDKFRPVVNFIEGETIRPNIKVVDITAWLIDFQFVSTVEVENIEGIEEVDSATKNTPEVEEIAGKGDITLSEGKVEKNWISKNNRVGVFCILAAIVIIIGSYIWWGFLDKQCMYWAGDHYEIVDCKVRQVDRIVVALDKQRVNNLKLITRRDTITAASIRKIYYTKVKVDSVDFYTAGGEHPKDNRKRLLPLTAYIFNKYILDKQK